MENFSNKLYNREKGVIALIKESNAATFLAVVVFLDVCIKRAK